MSRYAVLVGCAYAILCGNAYGASVDVVSAEDINSSKFTLRVTSLSQAADFLAVRINPVSQVDATFKIPAWEDFADGSLTTNLNDQWGEVGSSKFLAAASGSSRTDLAWELLFNQDPTVEFLLDIVFFSGNDAVTSATLHWTGETSTSFFGPTDWITTRSEVQAAFLIPLPAPISMGLLGFGGLAVVRRRRAA